MDAKDYDRLTRFPGSYYLLVSSGEGVRLFGDAAGLCRLLYAVVGDVPVVSTRSDVLARLIGAGVNDQWLARALVFRSPPPPLADETPWDAVGVVPAGQNVTIDRALRIHTRSHWHPPQATHTLREGASALTAALAEAVAGRVRQHARASCDLSGGKDSTAVTFLADRAATESSTRLLALTMPGIAPDNDDHQWAREAVIHLPHAHHIAVTERQCPLPYHDLGMERPWTEEPSTFGMHSARYRHLADHLRHHRSDVHLTGHGGDDILEAPLAYLSDSRRRRPWRAVTHARGHANLTGTPFASYLADMVRPGGYSSWLRHLADQLHTGHRPTAPRRRATLGWTDPPTVPPWIAADAAASVRDDLRQAAQNVAPPTTTQGQFAAVCRLRAIARKARLHQQFMDQLGVRVELPYLDRAVVEACLAVRGDERTNPWRYKPLLDAAMTDVVPRSLLARTSKGHYTEDTMTGLRRQHRGLAEILADSLLARHGLVDATQLRRSFADGGWERVPLAAVTTTIACELWLRDAHAHVPSTPPRMGAAS